MKATEINALAAMAPCVRRLVFCGIEIWCDQQLARDKLAYSRSDRLETKFISFSTIIDNAPSK
jgi:hypothetical protein